MGKKIIYMQTNGTLAILQRNPEQINPDTGVLWTDEEVAQKDVPKGFKYKIIDDSEEPTDRSFRDAWEADDSDLTDGVGGDHGNLD
tara:strand:- start:241 stop:498 length:258 start_codon:yes stop_codon:yes gene_type:complete